MATFKPLNQVVALKMMEFEGKDSITMMQREVQLMSLSKHPNVSKPPRDRLVLMCCRFYEYEATG